jgi:hypothetical protein
VVDRGVWFTHFRQEGEEFIPERPQLGARDEVELVLDLGATSEAALRRGFALTATQALNLRVPGRAQGRAYAEDRI